MAANDPLLPWLMAVLERTDAQGARVYRDDEIIHALPLVLLPGLAQIEGAAALSFLADFLVLAGLLPGETGDAAMAKAQAFYDRFPANARLLADIEDFVKTNLGDGPTARARLARMLGEETAVSPLGGGVRPAGTAPGGVLGRLATAAFTQTDAPPFTFDSTSTAER